MPIREALTFDDVSLVPAYSQVLPNTADTRASGNEGNSGADRCGTRAVSDAMSHAALESQSG